MKAEVTTHTHTVTDQNGVVIKTLNYLTIKVGEKEVVLNVGDKTASGVRELATK